MTLPQLLGDNWRTAVHPDDREHVTELWRDATAVGAPLEYEVRLRGADGAYRWFLTRAVPLRDGRGHIVKWYGVATDIEDRKRTEHERDRLARLEAELTHVNRVTTMGELAASISHEVRQPLTGIGTNANTAVRCLARDEPDLERARDAARRIARDVSRVAEILDRMRSLYTKGPPKHERLDVNDVVTETLALLKGEAGRHAVTLCTELGAGLPSVTADRVQLQQVVMNLALNGIEAMRDGGGELTVTSRMEPRDVVLISVSDTGVGLPPEDVERIFDAFFTTKPQGSGMGLRICRAIVEAHGGRLWARANAERGATFMFTLPATATALPA
jgi:signal transduction histidine kinase